MERITCGHCGWDNRAGVTTCTNCGRPVGGVSSGLSVPPAIETPSQSPGPIRVQQNANPAVIALVLGALGFFMCGPITALPGLFMARKQLKEIKEGRAPKSNEGLAKAAFWLCLASTVLYSLFLLIWIAALVLGPILSSMK